MTISELFTQLSSISSRTDKELIFVENKTGLVEQILLDTYGPAKYNIKKLPTIVESGDLTIDDNYDCFHKLLLDLSGRVLTGNDARQACVDLISQYNSKDQVWLLRILYKNLQIGIGETYVKNTGITKKFPVALANNYKDYIGKIDVTDGNWFISRKLDGCVDYYTNIEFEDGTILPIGEVVENRIQGKIKSWDGKKIVYKDIEGYYKNISDMDQSQKIWYEIDLTDGKVLKITGNDKLMTQRGWVRVDELIETDKVLVC